MMNRTEQKIFDIIRADVCGHCSADVWECERHTRRCYAGYKRQAREIYLQVLEPLEEKK